MLAAADLIVLLDSIAGGVQDLEAALGITGIEAGTVSQAAASNRDTLAALNDATVQADLTPVLVRRAEGVKAGALYAAMYGHPVFRALDRHYGSLAQFLKANNCRVHANLRKIGFLLDPQTVMSPVVDPVARYDGTGAGTGTFTAGSSIDTSLYGAANLEVVGEVIGAVDRTVRFTLQKFDGAIETRDVTITTGMANGTAWPIGLPADRYVGVTLIETIGVGGDASDRLRVRSIVERTLP